MNNLHSEIWFWMSCVHNHQTSNMHNSFGLLGNHLRADDIITILFIWIDKLAVTPAQPDQETQWMLTTTLSFNSVKSAVNKKCSYLSLAMSNTSLFLIDIQWMPPKFTRMTRMLLCRWVNFSTYSQHFRNSIFVFKRKRNVCTSLLLLLLLLLRI